MQTTAERLKQIRELEKLKQSDMAEIMGISPNNYSSIETGVSNLTVKHAIRISKKFHINLHWLLTGEDEPYITLKFNSTLQEAYMNDVQILKKYENNESFRKLVDLFLEMDDKQLDQVLATFKALRDL